MGAPTDDGVGSAYEYRFDGVQWIEEQKLTALDTAINAYFGSSVSLSGDTAAAGALGVDLAYVYPLGLWHSPWGKTTAPVASIRFFFPREMDPSSFSLQDDIVSFSGPLGALAATDYTWSADAGKLEVTFYPQSALGVYQMEVGPDILDAAGTAMNFDHDSFPGEIPDDQYTAAFTLVPARIVGHTPNWTTVPPVDCIRLNFNGSMDQRSFSLADDILSFTGPAGALLPTGYGWVDSQTLEVTFSPPMVLGRLSNRCSPPNPGFGRRGPG